MNTQIQQPKQENPLVVLRNDLDRRASEYAKVLPPGITPAMFARVAVTAIQNKPGLLRADRQSLFVAIMQAAEDGLLPDGREGALVPYKKNVKNGDHWEEVWTVQWLPMVEGVRKMLWESAGIILHTKVVYARDEYDYQEGLVDNPIFHRPLPGPRSASDIVAVYSIAKFPDGRRDWDWMWKEEIEQVRSKSRAGDSGPWNDPVFYSEMAIKTVVHHHSKALPMSSQARRAIERGSDLLDGAETRAPRQVAADEPIAELTYDGASPMENLQAPAQRSVDGIIGAMARGEPVPATTRRRRTRQEQPATGGGASGGGGEPQPGIGGGGAGGIISYGGGGGGGGGGASVVAGQGAPGSTGDAGRSQPGMGGGGAAAADRIILRDPDGTTYYKDTGEIIQYGQETNEAAEARAALQPSQQAGNAQGSTQSVTQQQAATHPQHQSVAQQGVMAAMRELMDSPQPHSREEYISWVSTKWEYATTDDKVEALRQWWGMTGGTRTQFGVTQADTKAMADKMRRPQP